MKLFDGIPVIKNERIVLKRLTDGDIPSLLKMTADTDVYRYLPTFLFEQQYKDMQEMIKLLYTDCFERRESLILGIYTADEGLFCGLGEFYGFNDAMHKTCIGYRLMKECWGRGIASQAAALMVDYLYTKTNTEIITASTMIENAASARVLEKCGFIRTARAVPEDWGYQQPTIADKWFR